MNKFLLYLLLILVFLGISKGITLGHKSNNAIVIENHSKLRNYFEGRPLSVILIDYYQTGMIIKTYYHKYKVVYDYKAPQIITMRVSKNFSEEHLANIGMSILRRSNHGDEDFTPLIPGSLFIGNQAYGHWSYNSKDNKKYWVFHRTYQSFNKTFGWGDFIPSYEDYQEILKAKEEKRPFYGINNEFGTNGEITQKNFPEFFHKKDGEKISIKDFFKKLLRTKSKWIYYE